MSNRGLNPQINKGLLLGVPAIMFGLPLYSWLAFITVIREGHGDFRAFYAAGWMARSWQTATLYDYATQKLIQDVRIGPEQIALPFNHLSFESLLFVPFTFLSYQKAWLAYLAFNVLLLVMSVRLLSPYLGNLASTYRWAPAALCFTFLPVSAALMQGQDSILLLTLLTAAYVCLQKHRDFWAGILLGCALFKFQIALPIALLFLLWKQWKLIRGFALSSALVAAVSLLLIGWSGLKLYFQLILNTAQQSNQVAYGTHNLSSMPNLRGFAFGLGVPIWAVAVASAAVIFAVSRWKPSFEISVVVAALVSYHFLIHDMSILLIPCLLALNAGRWHAWLLFVAPVLMVYAPSMFYLAALPIAVFLFLESSSRCVKLPEISVTIHDRRREKHSRP